MGCVDTLCDYMALCSRPLRKRLTAAPMRCDERGGDHANRKGHKARTRTDLLHVVQTFLPEPGRARMPRECVTANREALERPNLALRPF